MEDRIKDIHITALHWNRIQGVFKLISDSYIVSTFVFCKLYKLAVMFKDTVTGDIKSIVETSLMATGQSISLIITPVVNLKLGIRTDRITETK